MEAVPPTELTARVARLQELLAGADISLALIRQPTDLFYYTGTVAEGFLAVPAEGRPRFLVRRPRERPAVGETPWEVAFYSDLRELPGRVAEAVQGPRHYRLGDGRSARRPLCAPEGKPFPPRHLQGPVRAGAPPAHGEKPL